MILVGVACSALAACSAFAAVNGDSRAVNDEVARDAVAAASASGAFATKLAVIVGVARVACSAGFCAVGDIRSVDD